MKLVVELTLCRRGLEPRLHGQLRSGHRGRGMAHLRNRGWTVVASGAMKAMNPQRPETEPLDPEFKPKERRSKPLPKWTRRKVPA